MHMESENTLDLMREFHTGNQDAAAALFSKHFDKLDRFASNRISPQLQQRVGGDDIAQSVYRSFFQRAKDGVFEIEKSGDLWRLLAFMANRKIRRKVEFNTAKKRSIQTEQSADASERRIDIAGSEPDPSEQASVDDAIESVLSQICRQWKEILELAQKSTDVPEIASATGVSETDVRKVLILRMKCTGLFETEDLAQALDCSAVTIRRMWRQLLEFAEGQCDDS